MLITTRYTKEFNKVPTYKFQFQYMDIINKQPKIQKDAQGEFFYDKNKKVYIDEYCLHCKDLHDCCGQNELFYQLVYKSCFKRLHKLIR